MSDMAEIRNALTAIQDQTSRTAEAISWIKEGMERGTERMDKHDQRLTGLEAAHAHNAGKSSVIGAVAGAGMAAVFSYFFGHHKIT
jgi:hypothetical protein